MLAEVLADLLQFKPVVDCRRWTERRFSLSDNGAAFPFAKENCCQISMKTPLIARWPGQVKPGQSRYEALPHPRG